MNAHCQSQLFQFWSQLSENEKKALQIQIEHIDEATLKRQRALIKEKDKILSLTEKESLEPFDDFGQSGNKEDRQRGEQLIAEGRLGCVLVAGGQGTRLQFSGPKGCYPISVVHHKSLFQLFAERVVVAGKRAGRLLSVAIMTSPDNDEETRQFFQTHHYFGLKPEQIAFFVQETLPLLDEEGSLFLKSPWEIAVGPDGNGHLLVQFAKAGILSQWVARGIEHVHIVLVDNPLADPFDPELLGYHDRKKAEITLKCIERIDPEESVGVIVRKNGKIDVLEYSEMTCEEKQARLTDQKLKHRCANISLFCFSLAFIARMFQAKQQLPLHVAKKSALCVDQAGKTHLSDRPIAWKFETFIFDWLKYAESSAAIIFPRQICFSPLKNLNGENSPATVKKALFERDRQIVRELTGLEPSSFPFELPAEFYNF